MLKLSSIKADLKRQFDGDWVPYPLWPGVRFLVASTRLPAYQQASRKQARDFAKKYRGEEIPQDELHKSNGQLIAEHLLKGWDGIDVEYSPELAEERLTDPEFDALADAVLWCASKLAQVDAEFVEETEKNSAAPSATS